MAQARIGLAQSLLWREEEGDEMRSGKFSRVLVGLILFLLWSPDPASSSHNPEDADWLDVKTSLAGTLDAMPDLASPASREGHGTMMSNFEDQAWTWRAVGSGSCTEIVIDVVAVYPPRSGDWASARAVAIADDTTRNFCAPGTRLFHGTGRVTGGGGNYAGSAGEFSFTGAIIGDGPATVEKMRMDSTGRLRCYHVRSVGDRAEQHHH